ncbi:unnamed protein product [Cyprideis torosa]|uniref:Sodium channel protein n=1 Tax=Cyprideis torosa TaxID=163714 RepID=A0A7R8W413_9CRUS|nr:unnamed protein product [Cyprideis torosa]CAG0880165.1 unnamed protein product [Cyprideis torosa]
MSEGSETPSEEERSLFRPLTRDSLAVIEARIEEETAKKKELQKKRQEEGGVNSMTNASPSQTRYDDEDDDDGPKSDPNLEAGMPLPIRLAAEFNPELVGTPIEDIDPYYSNQRTFVVISKGKDIFRFSSTSSLWTISPFNPLRRTALYILVHPLFSILIISTILANCILMSMTPTPKIESTEVIFTSIYTFEAAIKVTARGFIMEKFTYLRDAWNWLDFIVIALAYLTMGVDLGNFAALRTFRVLRALKTVAIVPGLKTIVGAVIESVKNLKDVIILTMFSLSVFALLGLQVYMGYLTQKCILDVPSNLTLTDEEWFNHCSNSSHWYMDEATKKYPLCGNATGAGTCPDGYTCIQGFGGNPDYGYTSFDTFGWALLSSFRLMTQDAWETLYHQVLRSAGPWHMLFFIVIIFIGSYYLVNLILAIVAMSYDELNKKAEAEEKAQAKEQAAMKREEEIVMESAAAGGHGKKRKSPRSPRSTNSGDSMLYGQQSTGDEEIDRRRPLVDGDSLNEHKGRLNGKVRSAAYPHSAHHRRTSSFSSGLSWRTSRSRSRRSYSTAEKVPLVTVSLSSSVQDSVPFADDSDVLTPISDTAGALASSGRLGSRYASCDSHLARLSFTSHGDLSDSSFPVGKNRRPPSRVKPESYSCGSKSSQILDAKALQDLVLTPRKQAPGGGGPKQGDAIEAFLRNIFSERDLNLQYIDKESANGNGIAGPHGEGDADLAEGEVERTSSNPFVESNGRRSLDVKDVMDLKDLIDQAGRRSRASSRPENKHLLGGEVPRWNFTDFMHSFMIVFRVLCGEWIESMWDCMVVGDLSCIPFFMATVVIGNLVVLNLFLALLLSSFGASSLSSPQTDSDTNKLTEAFARFGRFFRWIKGLLRRCFRKALRSRSTRVSNAGDSVHENSNSVGSVAGREENGEGQVEAENPQQTALTSSDKSNCVKVKPVDPSDGSQSDSMEFPAVAQHESRLEQSIDVGTADILLAEQPADCCSPSCYKNFPFLLGDDESPLWQGWAQLRCKTFRLIENKYFETAVITMILLSSLALALEDVYLPQKPLLQDILYYMDRIFTVIFFLEMLIKWLALGFNSYFHNAWCWLDFVIVMVSLINLTASLLGANGIQAFKTMRTLRALRPLRALSRMQGMRVVVNALVQAIPSIFNVLMVCLIFWLIFAIMGVQMFAGKFYKCLDEDDHLVPVEIVDDMHECIAKNYTWVNSKINFDNVLQAYLALFQVATFKGWIPIMGDAIDSRGLGKQPVKEHNTLMYLYFVFFIIIGSLFTLNLFIGVIIDNFNEQKKKMRGSLEMFMTEEQKKYYNAMKKMGSKKPLKAIPRPKWRPQAIVFEIVTNSTFDLVIMGAIGLNMVVMTLDRYQMSKEWEYGLEMTNTVFIVIFTSECLLKIFALRWFYFKEPWNLFDFVVVILSILGLVLSDIIERYFVSPTLLRVVRVAKVGRVLRLVKGAKGIRTLLFALAMSLPALFNIFLLLFLVMFIYAIFGMSFFMHVKYTGGLDPVFNFETFGNSMILLFQIMTSAGWDSVLEGITNEDDCEKPDLEKGNPGNCGSYATGLAYLVSYLMISFLIVINMYIAVILENYSQATEDVSEGLTGDDYDMYYEIWQQFDPKGTQYIPYSRLSEFLHVLEPPLQIHKPNKYKIVSMDIPLCTGDRVYCVDVLDALTKDFFARKGNPIQDSPEFGQVAPAVERPDYEPISSTLWRQREEHCVRMVQKAWVQHKNMKIQERQRRQQQEMEKQRRQQEEMETEQSGDAQLAEDASNPPPSNFNSMGGERDSPSSPPSQTN